MTALEARSVEADVESEFVVRVGFVVEYRVLATDAVQVQRQVAAVRAAGLDLDSAGEMWAGPDLISIEPAP